jgi:hypothetical protein
MDNQRNFCYLTLQTASGSASHLGPAALLWISYDLLLIRASLALAANRSRSVGDLFFLAAAF